MNRVGPASHDVQIRLRTNLASLVAPKSQPSLPVEHNFYPQQPTCQIPNLHYLLKKFLGERDDVFYVEVGAYDGVLVSNTWGLAERGWRGLLIEPVPHLADLCRENYAHRERVSVIQAAIGRTDSRITLHLGDVFTTANADLLDEFGSISWAASSLTSQNISVDCLPLDRVLRENGVLQNFDLLVVDVEGFETEIFAGFDLDVWRPKMLIVELTDTHPDLHSTARHDALLGRRLVDAGYIIAHKDWINTVFVREDVWNEAVHSS